MAVKRTGQMSFVEAFAAARRRRGELPLDRMAGLVKWYRFEKLLAGCAMAARVIRPGRPLVLFKALLLQSLYGLSERELEEALGRPSVVPALCRAGAGGDDSRPHGVHRFRNALIGEGLLEKLFDELDRQLEKAGVILKRGTMLDATLIEAVSAPPTAERASRDPDARFGGAKARAASPSATRRMSGWTRALA